MSEFPAGVTLEILSKLVYCYPVLGNLESKSVIREISCEFLIGLKVDIGGSTVIVGAIFGTSNIVN